MSPSLTGDRYVPMRIWLEPHDERFARVRLMLPDNYPDEVKEA